MPAKDIAPVSIKKNKNPESSNSKSHIIVEIIEYVPDAVVTKTVIKKSKGNISVMAFDAGEALVKNISPFDTYVQIIEGKAELVVDEVSNMLRPGQGIIIPAYAPTHINPSRGFKMILTIIKNEEE